MGVAVGAPDSVLPPPEPPGAVGLLCMYVSIITAMVGTTVTGLLSRMIVEERAVSGGLGAGGNDEESGVHGVMQPLLGGVDSSKHSSQSPMSHDDAANTKSQKKVSKWSIGGPCLPTID